MNLTELKALMSDTLYNESAIPTEYDGQNHKKAGSDAIRRAILDAVGIKEWDPKVMKKMSSRETVYEIIETALGAAQHGTILTEQMNGYVDFVNIPLGGTKAFTFDDPSLFKISVMAPGHNIVDRQRITNGRFDVVTDMKALGIYTEWETYLTGQYDFDTAVAKTALSMAQDTGNSIYRAIREGINYMNARFRYAGAFDMVRIQEMVRNITALTGQPCVVLGTRPALARISMAINHQFFTDALRNRMHSHGWIERIHGVSFAMLPDIHVPIETVDDVPGFHFDDNFLMIVPGNANIIRVIREGEPQVYENAHAERTDNQLDWRITYREGVGLAIPSIWGAYYMSADAA